MGESVGAGDGEGVNVDGIVGIALYMEDGKGIGLVQAASKEATPMRITQQEYFITFSLSFAIAFNIGWHSVDGAPPN